MLNRAQWPRILLLSTGLLTALPITCNSIFAKRKPAPEDDGYDYVMVTGSNVPMRVRRGTRIITASPVEGLSAEEFRKTTQRGQNMGKLPASGR